MRAKPTTQNESYGSNYKSDAITACERLMNKYSRKPVTLKEFGFNSPEDVRMAIMRSKVLGVRI